MYVCIQTYTYIRIHTHAYSTSTAHSGVRAFCAGKQQQRRSTHAHINTYIHTHIHTCRHTYTHTYMHTYIHAHIHETLHTHTYIHTYTHTHIHTHVHRFAQLIQACARFMREKKQQRRLKRAPFYTTSICTPMSVFVMFAQIC
jgi:hypothetical protein